MNQARAPSPPQARVPLISPAWTWCWRTGIWGALLVLLVTVVYWPTTGNGFFWDDEYYVRDNLAIRSLPGLYSIWFRFDTLEQYYPLVLSTFWVEYHLWGLDPVGYHVVNFLLHAAAAVLVWRLLVRLAVPGAWLAAAIFAVHPVHVESVALMHELKNVLSCSLALGSILAYLRFSPPESAEAPAARGRWLYYALAFVLYVAALLAKTVTASVPAVLLVIYWWKRGRLTARDVARTAPFFAVGVALAYMTVSMEKALGARGSEFEFTLAERVLIAGRAFWFYAGKLAWPHPVRWVYPRWTIDTHAAWQYLFPAAAVAVIVGLWLARKRIGRGPLAAVLIFAGVLTPGLGFFDLLMFRFTFVVDHIQYHASIALLALAAAAAVLVVSRLPAQARWLAPVAGLVLLVPLAVITHQRTYVYQDYMTVMQDTVAQDPQSWVGHYYLAFALQRAGKYEEALAHFRKAIAIREQEARDNPTISLYEDDVAGFYVDIGLLERKMGRADEEESSYRKAIEIRENLIREHPTVSDHQDGLAWCYSDLANVQQKTARPAEAEASHLKAIAIREKLARDNPTNAKFKNHVAASDADLGLLYREMGRPAEAENAFHRAITIREQLVRDHPQVAEYQSGLAASFEDLAISQQTHGQPAEAVASRRQALEIRERLANDNRMVSKYQDDVAGRYVDLGLLQRDMGRLTEAQSDFRKAIEIRDKLVRDDPTESSYQDGLAWCYVHLADALQKTGRSDEADVFNRKALEIRQKLERPDKTDQ